MPEVHQTLNDALRMALQHHRAGNSAAAENICRRILATEPRQPDALHLLGVLLAGRGNRPEAIRLIEAAVLAQPQNPQAFTNLGRILADEGRLTEAIQAYRRVTALTPDQMSAWYNLALVCRLAGDLEGALAAIQRCIETSTVTADACTVLGDVLTKMHRPDDAITAFAKAASLAPASAEAHNNLGSALVLGERNREAVESYRRALRLKPHEALFHTNLGGALMRLRDFEQAVRAYDSAIAIDPAFLPALNGKGEALTKLFRFDEALATHKAALQLFPQDLPTRQALGETLLEKGDVAEAHTLFSAVLAESPGSVGAMKGLSVAFRAIGNFKESAAMCRAVLTASPNEAASTLALVTGAGEYDVKAEMSRLTDLLNRPDIPIDQRIAAGFALGKVLDETDCYDRAFAQYFNANELFKKSRAADGGYFDGPQLRERMKRLMAQFPAEFFPQRKQWGSSSEVPVFVVGMPRSGTTLVEQIIASHSQVFGAGELSFIPDYCRTLSAEKISNAEAWGRETIEDLANLHLNRLSGLGGLASRVVDKLPGNIWNLGQIATLFPNARVIFCQRDPRDTCLSCYFQWFSRNQLIFTYDLNHCGQQMVAQQELTEHWFQSLPLKILAVEYEKLVADTETQSRRLIDFLALDWEPGCLDFHKTQRPVLTASAWQVRQPIYTRSVGRWKHYEEHLGPLFEALRER